MPTGTPAAYGWRESHARPCLRARRDRRVRTDRPCGLGGGETVIVFDIVAAVLAVGAIGYLVFALVKPERF
ncbi:hypothetical protein B7495_17400 [Cryobacterium sp. LW097]|nr:hypothetical protein B7495_17400 [Cryobacterium sp. LW097]